MKCVNNYRIGIADHRCILNYESRYISNKYPALKARKIDVAKTKKKKIDMNLHTIVAEEIVIVTWDIMK